MVLEPGEVIASRYRLERKLGEGGMGVVWHAVHLVTRRPSALKFLKLAGTDPVAARKRFLHEARATSAVQHAGLVPVHDVLELDDGSLCMVMDLLRGESFGDRLLRERALPLPEVARVMVRVCGAVGAAHAVGVIHRDLKPDNIFLAIEPDGATSVKVLDFGIAKLTAFDGDAARTGSVTETGTLMGTPFYMAPEQLLGEATLDHRADLWAIGVILYEALAGVRPTQAENIGQVLKIVMQGRIVPLAERVPTLPRTVLDLVARLLAHEPKARPEDLREVVAVLAAHTEGTAPVFGAAVTLDAPQVRTPADGKVDSEDALARTMKAPGTLGLNASVGESKAPVRRRWHVRRSLLVAAAGVMSLAVTLNWWGGAAPRAAGASAASASPTTEVREGLPRSAVPEAERAFEEAMRALHDGTGQEVMLFQAAVKADPGFGGAYLRLWEAAREDRADGHEHLAEYRQRLIVLRSSLSQRDRELLDALDAVAPNDKLDAYLARHPDDTAAWVGRLDGTLATADRALAADPTLVPALAERTGVLWSEGHLDDARAALSRCLDVSPFAVTCLELQAYQLDSQGNCADAENSVRRWLELRPGARGARPLLAGLLAARGEPVAAVREALGNPETALQNIPSSPAVMMSVFEGDSLNVVRIASALAADVRPNAPEREHFLPTNDVMLAYTEMGDLASAGRVASEYLARRAAWSEPCPMCEAGMIGAAARAGRLDPKVTLDLLTAAFEARVKQGTPRDVAWLEVYAHAARTEEAARLAVIKLSALGVTLPENVWEGTRARVIFLAGRGEEARSLLETVTRVCSGVFFSTMNWAHATLYLGELDEQRHHQDAACAHYGKVLAVWGNAKPRSTTADEARARAKALGCAL